MATNYIQPGEVCEYTAGATISSGDLIALNNRAGVALTDIANGSTGSVALTGVYTVPKTAGATWSVGQAIYVISATGIATVTATGNVPAGFAFAAALEGATTGQLLLGGQHAMATAANVAGLTDSSGGAAADGTLAANGAVSIISIPVTLSKIVDGDLATTFTPGFAGTILRTQFVVTDPVTTADKLSTLNLEIGTTNVTGGTVALTSAACTPLGKTIAGAAVTATNVFTASDTISVEASSTTGFAEGAGVLMITVASDVSDDNTKDLATTVNAVLAALKAGGMMVAD
jgi:predicted RecA/RadA family phage recombinase